MPTLDEKLLMGEKHAAGMMAITLSFKLFEKRLWLWISADFYWSHITFIFMSIKRTEISNLSVRDAQGPRTKRLGQSHQPRGTWVSVYRSVGHLWIIVYYGLIWIESWDVMIDDNWLDLQITYFLEWLSGQQWMMHVLTLTAQWILLTSEHLCTGWTENSDVCNYSLQRICRRI